jgi:hypothetical protein
VRTSAEPPDFRGVIGSWLQNYFYYKLPELENCADGMESVPYSLLAIPCFSIRLELIERKAHAEAGRSRL